ncbi:MAG: nucleotidyltransferase domain-containing protein [Devosia sp.]|uniref:nucleotidyltransferase domain-containing protein n=1 Tax=Devosia sp. TaxID=1871048 RepID=UPI003394C76A
MNQQDIIAAAKAAFADDEAVRGLFLSGSFGRGTADEWSDVDLLAVVSKDDQRGAADRWRTALNGLAPVVYWNELERGGFLINAVTKDWLRCDLYIQEPGKIGVRAKNTIAPLIDRDGIYDGLPDALPPKTPNPHALRYQINEFIRILGLTPVAMGRGEYLTAVMGNGLLRGLLTDLFMQDVTEPDSGGILHLSKLLPAAQIKIMSDLPFPNATADSVMEAHLAIARVFMPRARTMAERLNVEWPEAFEAATRRVLQEKLGVAADW